MKKVLSVLLVCVIAVFSMVGCGSKAEKIDWENIVLGDVLPEPQSNMMELHSNDEEGLWTEIHDISENEYQEYLRWCKEDKGFTIDIDTYGDYFNGFNQDGYYLSLSYNESDDVMSISLEIPIAMEEYVLPDFATKAGLPLPQSKLGHYDWQYDDNFSLYVGNTTMEGYEKYKAACISAGFTVDSSEGKDFYSADNADGYELYIRYRGFDTIAIQLDCPTQTTTTSAAPTTTTKEQSAHNGMRKEFKEAMDSYEEFMDEYVTFMKKYKDSDDTISMLSDYTKFMSKYAEMAEAFAEWEEEDLNDAELAYYLEVQNRITQKLLSIA